MRPVKRSTMLRAVRDLMNMPPKAAARALRAMLDTAIEETHNEAIRDVAEKLAEAAIKGQLGFRFQNKN